MSETEKAKINPRIFFTISEGDKCILKKREDERPTKTEDAPAYDPGFVTFGPETD
jgi:hypothetical protein